MGANKLVSLKDCFKGFNDRGIGKVISPEQTCVSILKKLQTIPPCIYKHNIFIERPTRIPQYRIIGTEHYRQITGVAGANGKGHTKEQAFASGLMELAERYSCFKYLQDRHLVSSWKEMRGNPFKVEDFCAQFIGGKVKIDYRKLCDAQIRWVKGSTLEGERVYLPINLIHSVLQGTNGMASGNSFEEALLHAICEVIERHCLTIIENRKLKTPVIKQESINSPLALGLIERFKAIGLSPVIKDFSLSLGLPVIGAIIRFGKNECNISAGVATSREEALTRALTEISQALGVGGNVYKVSNHKHYFDNSPIISFEDVPCVDNNNIRLEIEAIRKLLYRQNMKVFYVNTTEKALNIPAVNVYISGAKYYDKQTTYKNSLIMLIDESFSLADLKTAKGHTLDGINLRDKNRGVYYYYMACLLLKESQYKEAITYFLRALATPSLNKGIKKEALSELGICYENVGEANLAVAAYAKLLDLSKGEGLRSLEKHSRIQSFIPAGKYFAGKSLYEEIKIARWRSHKKGQRLFIDEFRKYQTMRNSLTRSLNKALDYFESGNYHGCKQQVQKTMLLHPLVSKIYELNLLLAECFFGMKQYKKAINELLRAEKIDPDNGRINLALARYYKCIGQNKKYQEEADKGFQKTSTIFRMKINLFDAPQGRAGWIGKVI